MAQRSDLAPRLDDESHQATLQIGLLGPLTLARDGAEVELTGPKRRALLTLLALNTGVPVSQERIVEALWTKRRTGREESTLQVHVSHLRDALEPDRDGAPTVLKTQGSAYLLAREAVDVDITRFDTLTSEGRNLLEEDPETALGLLNEALGLWRGRPLQDVEYEEFAQEEIRRLELTRTQAVENRAEALVTLNRDAAAVEDLEALVRNDPTRERAVSLLMRALYRTGRQAEALRVFRRHGRHLAEQGLEVSPPLNFLEERILQHDPALLPEEMVSPGDIQPGRSVRGYELRDEVGSGSIGVVYRAFQAAVGREVAVKVVHPDLAQSPEFVRRFTEEAKIVAGLEHPHIVPLHDFWREPAGAFLVMRWMEGGSLEDRMDEPWGVDELGRVFDQLADAIGYAHSAGIVHRDVKPANVLFDAQGNTYLCDFGLAVPGIDTGAGRDRPASIEAPYASPELLRGEGPSVASDVYGLGVLLAEAATGGRFQDFEPPLPEKVREVVQVATAANPADRYPDMAAFRSALRVAIGPTEMPAPRRVRRNPYKGLEPFDEGDRADFYGRDDVVDTLIDMVGTNGLTAVIGASGSGKSSVVRAGLVPELRDGALPGSDEWFIVTMVPGADPFEEFHLGLRETAVGHPGALSDEWARELRDGFNSALDGPNNRALLVIDQFEEVFSSEIDDDTRQRFLDNLVDLATDRAKRVRVLLTLRADFSDRPLAHPRFGELISEGSMLLAPMRPAQIEDVIRRPAARVGIQVEPGLISEIVRDVSSATAYLPHLQYVLSELFERRSEDRLTVQAYRSLGGVHGVLERRAETTYSSLSPGARDASRQLFLRMVHLGEHGEETRRRLPLTDLRGLGNPSDVDEALEAFASARILTYDRDPVTRTPTVEVAHETVISQWTRFRIWIDEARADVLAHRRLSAAASSWSDSGEDPAYLLTGGPLASAVEVAAGDRLNLNQLEARFVSESKQAEEDARAREAEREQEKTALQHRARRRLTIGIGTAVIAAVIAVLAGIAWNQRQEANELAQLQERQNTIRRLAAAAVDNLGSADPDLSLLLAIEGAELSLEAGDEVLPDVMDALHRSVINPRPDLIVDGARSAQGGEVLDYSRDGSAVVALAADGGAFVVDPADGSEIGRVPSTEEEAFGVSFHPAGRRILTIHSDGVREWNWRSGVMVREFELPVDVSATAAAYSPDGSRIAVGGDDGVVRVFVTVSSRLIAELEGHTEEVTAVDFGPTGTRLASAGTDQQVLFWDISTQEAIGARTGLLLTPMRHLAWQPGGHLVVAVTEHGEIIAYDSTTGERFTSYGNGNNPGYALAFDPTGNLMITAGADGEAVIFGAWVGGEAALSLPSGGVPLRDAAFNPVDPSFDEVATIGVDGELRIWRGIWGSELPARVYPFLGPRISGTHDGSRSVLAGAYFWYGAPPDWTPSMEVFDTATGETLLSQPAFEREGMVAPLAIAGDGSVVAWAGPSGHVEVADIAAGDTTPISDAATSNLKLALNSDGTLLAWTGDDGLIRVWDATQTQQVRLLRGHGDRDPSNVTDLESSSRVQEITFRPGSSELASVGYDGTLRVWEAITGTGRVIHTFDYAVFSVAYSKDGELLAAADRTGTVRIFDADTGEVLDPLPDGVSGPVFDLVFSPDGDLLVASGPGPVAHVWDVDTGRIVRRLRGSVYWPTSSMFINEGSELLVLSTEGVLRHYLFDPLDLIELAKSKVLRDPAELTEAECQQYLGRSCDD